jgi:hypothetical protein
LVFDSGVFSSSSFSSSSFPLPGAYGLIYGMPDDLRCALNDGYGTIADPTRAWTPVEHADYTHKVTNAVASRLPSLVEAAAVVPHLGVRHHTSPRQLQRSVHVTQSACGGRAAFGHPRSTLANTS